MSIYVFTGPLNLFRDVMEDDPGKCTVIIPCLYIYTSMDKIMKPTRLLMCKV